MDNETIHSRHGVIVIVKITYFEVIIIVIVIDNLKVNVIVIVIVIDGQVLVLVIEILDSVMCQSNVGLIAFI